MTFAVLPLGSLANNSTLQALRSLLGIYPTFPRWLHTYRFGNSSSVLTGTVSRQFFVPRTPATEFLNTAPPNIGEGRIIANPRTTGL